MNLLPKTKLTESAALSRFRHSWIIDLLIAILLFVISQSIESVVLIPAIFIWFFTGIDFAGLAASDDPTFVMEQVSKLMSRQPDWIALLSLIATVVVIIVCILYATKIERRPRNSLGFCGKAPALEYCIGYVIGIGLFAIAWAICLATGAATLEGISPSLSAMILPFFAAFLIQGLSEEVLCRGFLMQTLSIRYRPVVAIVVNSLFFMALHFLNSGLSLLALCNLFLFGVFASVYFWKRGSIWGVAAIHSAWNFTQGNLLGIKVSGSVLGPSVLSTSLNEAKTWMNGGDFGLEGGIAVTVVLLAATVILLFLPVRKSAQIEA